MHQDTTGSTSRRTFVKCGLLSAGVFAGSASAAADDSSAAVDRDGGPAEGGTIDRGVMRPYQWTPGRDVTVDDALEYQPARLDGPYRTYVVSYDHAPSYQAFLFVPEAAPEPDGSATGGETDLEAGDSLAVGQARGSPSESSTGYVTIDLESQ